MFVLLDDISSKTVGLSLAERPFIPTAEQNVEHIVVDSRNGSLTKKKEYKNIELEMTFQFISKSKAKTMKEMTREIKGWFLNKSFLSFSDDTEFFYKVKEIQVGDIENDIDIYGQTTVSFVFHPFQFKKTDPITMATKGDLNNPGTMAAEPSIKVFGTGNGSVTINQQTFLINGLVDYVTIDCELQEAHRLGLQKNDLMVGAFPILKPGKNTITWNAQVTKIEIEPRWVYL